MPDHVHMLINVPPKLAASSVVGYIKGKSPLHLHASRLLWEGQRTKIGFLLTQFPKLKR
jgi:putative transposase